MVDCKISTRGNGEKPRKLMKFMKTLVTYSAAVLFGLFSIRAVSYFNLNQEFSELAQSVKCPEPPKYWGVCLWEWNKKGNLRTMNRVFDRLGYVTVNATEGDDWDVLWSIEYPYEPRKSEIFDPLKVPLKKHQRINHFPGFGNITSKAIMTTRNRNIKYILPGFQFPQMIKEFQTYVAANPNAKFVEKNLGNRGIKLVERHEIKFTKTSKFYQRFMEKPFLVDERFMDFGIYVVVSSINPLRIYRFDQEVHLRFCPQPYYPFDKNILDKYVISDNRQDFMQLPETKSYFDNYGYSFKLSMEHYFRKKGHNVTELWRKIDEAIVQLVLNNEKNLMAETSRWFNSTHHFFELFRFDFLLNELLEPHITEVNMSPAVMPNSDVAERIAQTYEQLIHDTLKLLGAGSKLDLMACYDSLAQQMTSNSKNIAVNPGLCIENNCADNCKKPECKLCTPCLGEADIIEMHRAYREHVRRGGFKRIFPSKVHFNDNFIAKMSPKNQLFTKWFKAKCEEKDTWC